MPKNTFCSHFNLSNTTNKLNLEDHIITVIICYAFFVFEGYSIFFQYTQNISFSICIHILRYKGEYFTFFYLFSHELSTFLC